MREGNQTRWGSPLCGSWILFVREEEERRAARARCEVEASDSYDRLRGGSTWATD